MRTPIPDLSAETLAQRYALLCDSTRPEPDEQMLAYSVERGLQTLDQLLSKDLRKLARQGAPDDFADIHQALLSELERLREFCAFPALAQKFVVAFGGGFSAGKSSLINGVLGQKLLVTEVDPTTSLPTYLLHGEANEVSALNLFGHRIRLSEEAFLSLTHDEASRYGSHISRLLRAAFITRREFAWPHLALIDTPGYSKDDSDAHSERTDEHIARTQLNAAQAVVWVIDARQGCITEDDLGFLSGLRRDIPLFIALSRADQKPEAEIPKIENVIRTALTQRRISVAGIAAFSPRKPRAWPLQPLLKQLQTWNNQAAKRLQLNHSFETGFAKYDEFLAQEQTQAQDELNHLNRIAALSDDNDTETAASHLITRAKKRLQTIKTQGEQLETLWQTFCTQLSTLGKEVGIHVPPHGVLRRKAVPPPPPPPAVPRQPQPGDILCAGNGFPELVVLPGGRFLMGGTKYSDEKPVHAVQVNSFAIGKYPITQGQWKKVMGNNPSHFSGGGDQCPVENVSWDDAQAFIKKLNQQTGHTYRLPSEAEWEYACRAGSTGQWCFGDDESELQHYAWYKDNSNGKTHPVGEKKPTAFGLYDMHGNVWEWCEDRWHSDYNGAPSDGRAWVEGGNKKDKRVMRGGSSGNDSNGSRAAIRTSNSPVNRFLSIGFRVARTAP